MRTYPKELLWLQNGKEQWAAHYFPAHQIPGECLGTVTSSKISKCSKFHENWTKGQFQDGDYENQGPKSQKFQKELQRAKKGSHSKFHKNWTKGQFQDGDFKNQGPKSQKFQKELIWSQKRSHSNLAENLQTAKVWRIQQQRKGSQEPKF